MINRILAPYGPPLACTLVALAAGLSGCGSSGSAPTLPASGAGEMDAHLTAAQKSADERDRAGATAELDAFAVDVARARSAGTLTPSGYAALETGIARARARIGIELASAAPVSTTPTTPTTATTATTTVPPPAPIPHVAPTPQPSPPPGKVKAAKGRGPAKVTGPVKAHGHGHGDGKGHGKG